MRNNLEQCILSILFLKKILTFALKSFQWSEEVETAFSKLKFLFTSTPILHHPYPSQQFIVKVDTFDTGVGVMLSQRNMVD